jgi:hypothetical protein
MEYAASRVLEEFVGRDYGIQARPDTKCRREVDDKYTVKGNITNVTPEHLQGCLTVDCQWDQPFVVECGGRLYPFDCIRNVICAQLVQPFYKSNDGDSDGDDDHDIGGCDDDETKDIEEEEEDEDMSAATAPMSGASVIGKKARPTFKVRMDAIQLVKSQEDDEEDEEDSSFRKMSLHGPLKRDDFLLWKDFLPSGDQKRKTAHCAFPQVIASKIEEKLGSLHETLLMTVCFGVQPGRLLVSLLSAMPSAKIYRGLGFSVEPRSFKTDDSHTMFRYVFL